MAAVRKTHYATKEDLIAMRPTRDFFVGIDSDGCVFDTMEIKQKKCFHALMVSHWNLQPIEKYVRECAEFINLYSRWRGQNRFPCLLRSFDLLRDRPEVIKSGVPVPRLDEMREFIASGVPLGNPELENAARRTGSAELASILKWSKDVNRLIADTVKKVPPYDWALKSLRKISQHADAIVVSQTPTEALVREWDENDISDLVRFIAGQELGTKGRHIAMAAGGKYAPGRILMIGDAPGDMKAAKENNAKFFPVNPGAENRSWQRFHDDAFERFLAGSYSDDYENGLVHEFNALLPEQPPWSGNAS